MVEATKDPIDQVIKDVTDQIVIFENCHSDDLVAAKEYLELAIKRMKAFKDGGNK